MIPDLTYNDEHLEFLQNKIKEIKVAMFRAEASYLLCPPNNIITTLKNRQRWQYLVFYFLQ